MSENNKKEENTFSNPTEPKTPTLEERMAALILQAEQKNDAEAQFKLGFIYKSREYANDEMGAFWMAKAAKQNFVLAQFSLGQFYKIGSGVPQSDKIAAEWFLKAAEQGNRDAQLALGYAYESGKGVVAIDFKTAAEWFLKAAEQGDAEAQYKIGAYYLMGFGVAKDNKKAYEWLVRAKDQGFEPAEPLLSAITPKPSEEKKPINPAAQSNFGKFFRSVDLNVLRERAEKMNDPEAQFHLGCYYTTLDKTKQNLAQAIHWWSQAAKQGHANAQFGLGQCCENAKGIKTDLKKAISWYTKAAVQGHPAAQDALERLQPISSSTTSMGATKGSG